MSLFPPLSIKRLSDEKHVCEWQRICLQHLIMSAICQPNPAGSEWNIVCCTHGNHINYSWVMNCDLVPWLSLLSITMNITLVVWTETSPLITGICVLIKMNHSDFFFLISSIWFKYHTQDKNPMHPILWLIAAVTSHYSKSCSNNSTS